MKSTIRAFIALDISPEVVARTSQAIKPLEKEFPDLNWAAEESFHLTLKFLGDNVPFNEIHKIVAVTQTACNDIEPFELAFGGLGAFPKIGKPRTIWFGVTEGTPQLHKLARRISEELESIGYTGDRREFSPHITVARTHFRDREARLTRNHKNRLHPNPNTEPSSNPTNYISLSRMISERANLTFGASVVENVVLYSSKLAPTGATYEALAEIPLAPLGSEGRENAPFQPELYDDPSFEIHAETLEKHLPERLDATLDLESLDAEIDEELRAVCGAAFVDPPARNPDKSALAVPPRVKAGRREVPTSKSKLPDSVDLDEIDLTEFETALSVELNVGSNKKANKRGR